MGLKSVEVFCGEIGLNSVDVFCREISHRNAGTQHRPFTSSSNNINNKVLYSRPGFSINRVRRQRSSNRRYCLARAAGSNSYAEENSDELGTSEDQQALVDLASAFSDLAVFKEGKPPRVCTLRAFRREGEIVGVWPEPDSRSDRSSVFFKPLAASIQATAQAQNFETLSGRFAMLAFAVALGVEYVTGNSVFKRIDLKELREIACVCGASVLSVVGFTAAWAAKNDIGLNMSRGCQDLLDFALNDIVDALFYDDLL